MNFDQPYDKRSGRTRIQAKNPTLLFHPQWQREVHWQSFLQRFLSSWPLATSTSYLKENSIAVELPNRKLGFHSCCLSCCMVYWSVRQLMVHDSFKVNYEQYGTQRHQRFGKGRITRDLQNYNSICYLYGYKIWSLTVRDEHRFKIFKKKVLKMFGPKWQEVRKRLRKLYIE